jgi:DNA polymerase-3 subunit gamma/tau
MSDQNKSEGFIVTARKWRPLVFKDVVGQEHITHTLQNAIKNNRIHHAYLFCGPRGVGKTTTARILARAVNCTNLTNTEPCNKCENCISILENRSMDVIEIDGASNNSVDDVRKLRENAKYQPSGGRFKMYIIDEVHMLSNAAFNALLKILEEPPPHLMFVFATTDAHKVLPTITSRCQRFDFRRMEIEDITKQLTFIAEKEGVTIDEKSLVTLAKKGDGSMRDSQSIFDQVIAFCGKDITYTEMTEALHLIDDEFFFSISDAVKEKDTASMFNISSQIVSKGYDFGEILEGLLEHFRNIATIKATGKTDLIDSSKENIDRFKTSSENFSQEDLIRMMNHIATAEQGLRFATQPRIRFELALCQLALMGKVFDIRELIHEIRDLKKKPELINQLNENLRIESEKTNKVETQNTHQIKEVYNEKIEIKAPKSSVEVVQKEISNNLTKENTSKDEMKIKSALNPDKSSIDELLSGLFGAIEVTE